MKSQKKAHKPPFKRLKEVGRRFLKGKKAQYQNNYDESSGCTALSTFSNDRVEIM